MPHPFALVRLRTMLTLSYVGLAAFVVLLSFSLTGGVAGAARPMSVGACAAVLAVLTGWFVGRSLTEPLGKLRDAVTAIGQEKWDVELPSASCLELGELAAAFDLVKQSMRTRVQEVRQMRGRLEDDDKDRERHDRRDREIRRAQKMEAIGRLAGGIAHDFNNMLSIVLGYSGIALDGLRAEDPLFVPLTEIKRAGERSAELTRRLLALSRQQVLEKKVLDAAAIVDGMSRSIRRVLGEKNELEVVCESHPCRVEVARAQFEQVVMNLVLNARDAMSEGGKLTVDVRQVDVSPEEAAREVGLRPGRQIRIRMSDSGAGMSPDVEERIFEPFFTTKEQGIGVGLGLSTVFGCVQQHGGHVGVRSAVGKGTTFDIYLPEAPPRAPSSRELPSSGATRAAKTILVVEDEEQVRAVVERILRRHRYGVLVAGSPREAMSICEDHPGQIDLLVTDVTMPEMNGQVLAEQLLERRPEMKVLYMSGYLDEIVLPLGEEGGAFLQKPVTPEALRQKVRGILRATRVPPSHRGSA
jgi:two-component system, cell cycle sensor histidine kinase and response regulator CckA